MLLELTVENYAVVEQARIRFGPGLTILTGETGSGKSIVVDSLGLILGARASSEMIRTGQSKARVSAIFSVPNTPEFNALLDQAGIEHTAEEDLIVEREILAGGKSRAFVDNRSVTTGFLRQLASQLGDIHGQNEQQSLFATSAQRMILDRYADVELLLQTVERAFREWRETGDRLRKLAEDEGEKLRLLDLWTFQRNEIDTVQPKPGEDAELDAERKIQQNMTRLQESSNAAYESLYGAPDSASTQLKVAIKRVEELLRIDASLASTADAMKQAAVLLEDSTYNLRDYVGKLEGDPNRLEDIENRLAALDKLKRKYGGTLDEILVFREDVARKADEIENASEHREALEKTLSEQAAHYQGQAEELSEKRKAAAQRLSKQVQSELKSLAMAGTRLEVAITRGSWTSHGIDELAFLVSPNRGEELKPMDKIASGGELSRIALALKTALGTSGDNHRQSNPATLVFDEVDAGVGGAAAAAVGRRLKALSKNNQVICVTHLAQIAGFADHHYAVAKQERKGRVTTEVSELLREERAREIGRMLSGDQITPEALRQAEQLMQAGATI